MPISVLYLILAWGIFSLAYQGWEPPAKVLAAEALLFELFVSAVTLLWLQEQEQEQLQVLPPLIASASSTLSSVTFFRNSINYPPLMLNVKQRQLYLISPLRFSDNSTNISLYLFWTKVTVPFGKKICGAGFKRAQSSNCPIWKDDNRKMCIIHYCSRVKLIICGIARIFQQNWC